MAAKRRHWKEKDGRFWARVSIPQALRPLFGGKTQLTEPLGGDKREADLKHAAAVARLQARISQAALEHAGVTRTSDVGPARRPITSGDIERAIWQHYTHILECDAQKRAAMPTPAAIAAEHEALMQRIEAGDADPGKNPIGLFNLYTDYELMAGARHFEERNRTKRLAALRLSANEGDTRYIDAAIRKHVDDQNLNILPGSVEWRDFGHKLLRAEIDALQRTLERDSGFYNDTPTDLIIKPVTAVTDPPAEVPLMALFNEYIKTRQATGYHRDGGANWESVFRGLIKFLGHSDARKIAKRDLLAWRDAMLASGLSPKTISDKHLAAVNAVLKWAFANDRLPTNEAALVRQDVPKKVKSREKGYTTAEAVKVLRASIDHVPNETNNPSNRESAHLTAAKRWVPLLCAFTGARVTEMTQLRKEDVRQEDGSWILRITPEAGSVKTGQYRDVPLHQQIVALCFLNFIQSAESGPLFHNAKSPDRLVASARATSGKLSAWLNELKLVPSGVQPSHGWRHRFKTQGIELGISDRVLNALQGHAGKTGSDDYGDVTIIARQNAIDAFPSYDLSE